MATIRRKSIAVSAIPDVHKLSFRDVLDKAKKIGIPTIPLDIKSLIQSFGIAIESRILENDISGYLEKTTHACWVIVVNSLHHPRRQRFTLAHELGHFILHRTYQDKFVDKKLFRGVEKNSMETEANTFAAQILMPDHDFKFHHTKDSSAQYLADYFQVSSQAIRVKAETLGLNITG